jgi:hypothetical protein
MVIIWQKAEDSALQSNPSDSDRAYRFFSLPRQCTDSKPANRNTLDVKPNPLSRDTVSPKQYVPASFRDTFCNGINWLLNAEKANLVCANSQYYQIGTSNVQWNEPGFDAFLSAVCKLWEDW